MTIERSDLDLEAIKERAEKATPGPWRTGSPRFTCKKHTRPHPGPPDCEYEFDGWYDSTDVFVAGVPTHQDEGMISGQYDYEAGGILDPDDAAFIAASRSDVPALVEEVERRDDALLQAYEALSEKVEEVERLTRLSDALYVALETYVGPAACDEVLASLSPQPEGAQRRG